jgi:hypothetical protein
VRPAAVELEVVVAPVIAGAAARIVRSAAVAVEVAVAPVIAEGGRTDREPSGRHACQGVSRAFVEHATTAFVGVFDRPSA